MVTSPTVPIITIKDDVSSLSTVGDKTWPKLQSSFLGLDYLIWGEHHIKSGQKMIVEPEVQIHFEADAELIIDPTGTLDAQGTSSMDRINFRGVQSTAGYWHGITVNSNATIILDFAEINFGGGNSNNGCLNVNDNVSTTSSSVTNTNMLNGVTYELFFFGGSITDAIDIKNLANNNIYARTN